ncbi:MAG: hypothetical protein ACYDHZ_00970 [Dehalococcoidia bacterium]
MALVCWGDKLRKWRKDHEDEYAKTILSPPEPTTALKAFPFPGTVLIMGAKRRGKSALAHTVAEKMHDSKGLPAVLHLPASTPLRLRQDIQKLLPPWMKLVTSMKEWPKQCIVIYDEAAQEHHARRTQSDDAVELENMIGISGQREQLIIFISHHSRKLDPNIIRDIDRIAWKCPTYAHWIFERNELTDFVLKAVDFFKAIKTDSKMYRTTLMMDFHNFRFQEFTNGLPSYWTEELSRLFENIKIPKKGGGYI